MTIIEDQFAWLEELITSMATQKLEEEKAITSSSMGVPTYSGLDLSLGFFCGVGFVGSTNVVHDAHVLGTKHHVTLFYSLEMDSSSKVTHFISHVSKP
jgi:hypothetical protein